MKKSIFYFIAFLFATLCVITLSFASANAEAQEVPELFFVEEFTGAQPVIFNGQLELKLSFKYKEKELSFYWAPDYPDEEYDFTQQTWVEIMFKEEIINSGYVE